MGRKTFPEAETAVNRRTFRIARRRIQRRNQRLALLQDLFSQAVCEKDPQFFVRLREGMLHEEDKTIKNKNNLFADDAFDDKAYHKKYPTIYHLRSELIHSAEPHDVRLVYLALHHIIKYRGHFLFEGNISTAHAFDRLIDGYLAEVSDALETPFECSDVQALSEILCNRELSRTIKQKKLYQLFNCKSNTPSGALLKTITGGSVKLKDIFIYADTADEDIKIEFGSDSYEAQTPLVEALLGEDYYILEKAKAIHDWAVLESILHGYEYLSDAKVGLYDDHAGDLQLLKKVVRRYAPQKYTSVFRDPSVSNNYCAYAGITKVNGSKKVIDKLCSQADFCKYVSSVLNSAEQSDPDVQRIIEKIAAGTFMPRLKSKENSVVPNQIHLQEMNAILRNAEEYLPFLSEKDDTGLTVSDKIRQILCFRIPYYVGPLNHHDPNAANTWVARRSDEKIYPWNFDEIVDKELSASRFITRMTSQCTYLPDQSVLPRNSLLYSKFTVLNELNNLKINGEPIPVTLKQKIFTYCFMQRKKVTISFLQKYLRSNGIDVSKDDISGIDGEFKGSFGIWQEMHALLGDAFREDIAEEIIRLSTILGDDRKMFEQKLRK